MLKVLERLRLRVSNLLSPLKGQIEWVILLVVILFISFHYPLFYIVLIFMFIKIYTLDKKLCLLSLLISALIMIRFYNTETIEPNLNQDAIILSRDDKNGRYLVKSNVKFYLYVDEDLIYDVGDTLNIRGSINDQKVKTFPYEFDASRYQLSLNIHGSVTAITLKKTGEQFTIYRLKDYVHRYIEEHFDKAKPYIKTFILADKTDFQEETKEAISSLGVAHLFAVSGLHISFVAITLFKGLGFFKFKEGTKYLFLSIVLIIYLILTAFSPSILRASIMVILLWLNKKFSLNFTPFDLISILCIGFLIVNPYYIYQSGFILTFLVSGTLLLSQPFLKHHSKLMQSLIVSLIAYLITLPIITNFTFTIAPMTIIFNLIFVPYTMFFLLPIGYLTFFMPFLEPLYAFIILGFEGLLYLSADYFYVGIPAYFAHPLLSFMFYPLFYLVLKHKHHLKPKLILFLYVALIILVPKLNFTQEVTFFNVIGDSILIRDAFDRCNVLIDTGSTYSEYQLINTLKSKQINRLDVLFISHFHEDHYGAYEALSKAIKIEDVISYDAYHPKIHCGAFSFIIYKLPFSENVNNQGIIIKALINQETYLFTGDIELEAELMAIEHYELSSDYLKVAHHGSNTSTSEPFLNAVKPKEAVISVHKNNRFNHPDDAVINRLNQYQIITHRTDLEGTISFVYIFDKRVKKTLLKP